MSTYVQLSRQVREGKKEQIYFLHGEEEYVKDRLYDQVTALLRPVMLPELSEIILRDADEETVIGACMTPPMMAESKTVIVRGMTLMAKGEQDEGENEKDSGQKKARIDRLTDYLKTLPENVHVVFFERGKAPGTNRLVKWLNKNTQAVEFTLLSADDATAWMTSYMKNLGFSLDRDAADQLFYFAGPQMGSVVNELEKIRLYLQGTGITRIRTEQVRKQVEDRSSVRIFTLTDALGMGQIQKAYEVMEGIRRGDVDSYQLMYMIARQYRLIARTCMLSGSKLSTREIISQLGVQDFVYRGLQKQAAATGLARAQKALEILLDADEGLKTGRYRDEDLVIESCMAMIGALYNPRVS